MNTILEQFQDKINGTFSFFDRMIIKGHLLQLFSQSGRKYFLSQQDILLKDFSAYANQMTTDVVSYVENMATSLNRPLVYLTSAKIPKEQTALRILHDNPVDEGLICILSVVEGLRHSPLKKIYNFWSAMIKRAKDTGELPQSYNIMNQVELPDESVLPNKTKEIEIIPEEYVPIIKEIALSPSPNSNEQFLYRYGPAIVFLLNTGLRCGELLALEKSSYVSNGNRHAIKIKHTLSRIKNREDNAKSKTRLALTKPKFPNSKRTIPFNKEAEFCWSIMKDLYSDEPNHFNGDLLLTTQNGWPPTTNNIRNTLIAGIPEYSTHAIRHYFATKIVRKAANMGELKDVAELIGDSYEVIINTYFHSDEGKKVELIDAILAA